MKTVYLVACVSKKARSPLPAEELYRSEWFWKARQYVTGMLQKGDLWFILSAKYHLVPPRQQLAPYEKTLLKMSVTERQAWATIILPRLESFLDMGDKVVFLAGERYREFLELDLVHMGFHVETPMRGLGIGKQLQWLQTNQRKSLW